MINKRINSNWFVNLIFILVLAGLSWYFNFDETFFKPPQSVHTWRQTNSLSMTQMYYQYNLPFFQPEIQNQNSDHGMSGKSVGEFPVIYFLMAKIWQIFGKSEATYRIIQWLILLTGCFFLFRLLIPLTGNAVRAGFISLLVVTSPMFIFYGPNFLPDAPALSFTFIAWYLLYRFTQSRKAWLLWVASVFMFLALTLKITTGVSIAAIGFWMLFETLFIAPEKRIFNFRFIHYIPFIIGLAATFAWYRYVTYYTELHGGHFSVFGTWPIWRLNHDQILKVVDGVRQIYFREYFSPVLQYITIAVWVFMLFRIRKIHPFLGFLLIVMQIGFLAVYALWFQLLEAHDYYLISQMQSFVIVWIVFFIYLKDKKWWNHWLTGIVLVAAIAILAHDGMFRHTQRYIGWMNEHYTKHLEALTEIEPYFQQWGIGTEDKVISIPDNAMVGSLYYMDRKGYINFGNDFTKEETFRQRINDEAKYLIVIDTSVLRQPVVRKFATDSIGSYRNVVAYRLKSSVMIRRY